ncbi:ClC family H(+)/Cl(-) exchange transporter [Enterococcus dongliensis]|uniref:ClC family H(+)/Cl(-) exchange transporter n=1 Tax=Enterococcus dongliensis TaxID=2559925 RepID=A0AAP5KNU5_9ENTE|nr:ClC family H(+)/Cl(-) exchange transporter [Enterococcus dongliensis]MDT2595859.1 ClC family H(+)/Cl(-) exchange transporter [Enterococcus dongliensis]MDT2602880.1 ClC family H(+)/Cl(-) exchange transporter [Enterococcus dongliensis]MDT2633926.1 ClC family H(+)/Cl(-) exchange transporter [Enterococcus dongliensis]MDT2637312.1 ClC family H(+)/Cl(-) exchange transporter [Enterococcus dongliensis]MDT2639652.1 ClC family H(+)/Cl(-) exchange transporter [Enterococcus dongliensis]
MKNEHEIKRLDSTKVIFILKGVLIGALAGVVVSLFRLLIEKIMTHVVTLYLWFKINPLWMIPWALVMLAIAFIVGRLMKSEPNIKGSGIPQVEGTLQGEIKLNWFSILWKKFIGGILSVGSGLFLGREGPSIQLGAMVGQGFSEYTQASTSEKKIFISSGAAAGLSAAFNAPIAGLLFVIEEVHHHFSPLIWLTSLTAALTANLVSLNFFGLKPVLFIANVPSLPLKYYGLLLLLGVILGILGYVYQVVLLALPKLYKRSHLPEHLYGIIPFLLIIPVAFFFPHYLGGGNQIVLAIGEKNFSLALLILLFFLRFIFSMVSYGANLPGGIFLPILTLGALIGGIYGTVLHQWLGIDPLLISDFAIFAMAGYFTAIGKAPLTAIILVTEMVGNITHLMPLAVCSLTAYVINDLLGGNPIYESLLERLLAGHTPSITGNKTIIEIPVTAESSLDGMMVRDFNWPDEMLLISIRRGSAEILTHGDTVMKVGDLLMILTDEGHTQKIKQQIHKRSYAAISKKQEAIRG